MLVNAGNGANWFGTFLQWISPLRYINELAMRRMLAGRDQFVQDWILTELGFTWGVTTCLIAAVLYMIVCCCLSLFLMNYLARKG